MTYYEILGIDKNTSIDEINRAFRDLAKKYHPDLNKEENAKSKFISIYEAYSILKDPVKRATYDNEINYEYNFQKTYQYSTQDKTQQNNYNTYSNYEKWKESAKKEGGKYSETSYEYFKQKVLDKIIDIAKTTALVGIYTGALLLESIIGIIIRVVVVAIIVGIGFGLMYLFITQSNNQARIKQEQIQEERNNKFEGILSNLNDFCISYPDKPIPFDLKDKKIIIVENNKIDNLFYNLPEQYQAINKNEVGYILQLSREDIVVGHYYERNSSSGRRPIFDDGTGTPAYQIIYRYAVVDYLNKATVYGETVKGNEPPEQITHKGAGYGSNPKNDIYKKILTWLNNGSTNVENYFISDDLEQEKKEQEEKEKERQRLNEIVKKLNY
jgi:hypothetical protein